MSQAKIRNRNSNETRKANGRGSLLFDARDIQSEMTDIDELDKTLQEDPSIFLLNNVLMSVQFFENYDRDIKLLRENWFKEVPLDLHHKKCFHADSLFRLSGAKVKFSPRNGINKDPEAPLHPFRIYISSDNVEAAYDPSTLGRNALNACPQYRFTVRTNEKNEKSGCISLVEFEKKETSRKSVKTKLLQNHSSFNVAIGLNETAEQHSNYIHSQRKSSSFAEKYSKRLTKTDKSVGFQSSLKPFTTTTEGFISANGFYKLKNSRARLKPESVHSYRMNVSPKTSHGIPSQCFQWEEVKTKSNSKRNGLTGHFKSQKVLNSTAFMGYFCELLIRRLFQPLSLDLDALNESSVLEEFIVVNQQGIQYCLAPVIAIRDWNNFVEINKKFRNPGKIIKLQWPSDHMQKIMNILPCNAVPIGQANILEEDLDHEKTWKFVFPKAEEFLLLHMMHAHIRCYFFVLLIYKSFIETEINVASFGPKHLMHLLFWRVHKNFLAWPEDRPGETLLDYLKILYKKLQNKSLCDFFITTRNLFAGSLSKDLHKAQVLIKKIIENPVPHIITAVRNLHLTSDFYPAFDFVKLNSALVAVNIINDESKKNRKEKKQETVSFQNDQERQQQREKKLEKPTKLEQNVEEREQICCKLPVESINVKEILNFDSQNLEKCSQVLNIFTSHFIQMAIKSAEFKHFSQALFYLHQTERLFKLMISKGVNRDNFKDATEKINKFKEACYDKLKQTFKKQFPKEHHRLPVKKPEENSKTVQSNTVKKKQRSNEVLNAQDVNEKCDFDEKNVDENEIVTIKL